MPEDSHHPRWIGWIIVGPCQIPGDAREKLDITGPGHIVSKKFAFFLPTKVSAVVFGIDIGARKFVELACAVGELYQSSAVIIDFAYVRAKKAPVLHPTERRHGRLGVFGDCVFKWNVVFVEKPGANNDEKEDDKQADPRFFVLAERLLGAGIAESLPIGKFCC